MKLLSIPKLQQCNRWSLGMDKQFHPTHYNACNYISMLGFQWIHVSKRGHRSLFEPILSCCEMDPTRHISVKFQMNLKTFLVMKLFSKMSSVEWQPFCSVKDSTIHEDYFFKLTNLSQLCFSFWWWQTELERQPHTAYKATYGLRSIWRQNFLWHLGMDEVIYKGIANLFGVTHLLAFDMLIFIARTVLYIFFFLEFSVVMGNSIVHKTHQRSKRIEE